MRRWKSCKGWKVGRIVPSLCVGMHLWTLCVRFDWDAERPWLHSHAERGNDQQSEQGNDR
ncbi:hypothetical protein EMIT0194MI4_60122 [Pseudomonas sp. IT-194MI4]